MVELLVAMTIFAIVSVIIVQFMSTSSAATKKVEHNMDVQTEATQVMSQLSDTLMQATYVRVSINPDCKLAYLVKNDSQNTTSEDSRVISSLDPSGGVARVFGDASNTVDFVPDNYANYCRTSNYFKVETSGGVSSITDWNKKDSTKVIIDYNKNDADDRDKYSLVDNTGGSVTAYPKSTDADFIADTKCLSFRALNPADESNDSDNNTYYVVPDYIYAEYIETDVTTGAKKLIHVMYRIGVDDRGTSSDTSDDKGTIYMCRSEDVNDNFASMKSKVDSLLDDSVMGARRNKNEGLLTRSLRVVKLDLDTSPHADFYISANATSNSLLTDMMFYDSGYQYNVTSPITFRNSNTLTVRPQDREMIAEP